MRNNNTEVAAAFIASAPCNKFRPIHTDGTTIFSYSTPIVKRTPTGVVVDMFKYSSTTTRQQNDIRAILNFHNIPFTETTDSLKD